MSEVLDVRTALAMIDERVGRVVDGRVDPRGAMARALGLAVSGVRAVVHLDAAGLAACTDRVAEAVERSLALVVRVHSGDTYDALHAAADRGAVVLVARDLQEAVDLALVARRAAERALVPVLLACDLEDDVVEDVVLPTEAVVRRAIGAADDDIGSADAVQRMLFGSRRRRLPRWFDLEHPAQIGSQTSGVVRSAGRAGRLPYSQHGVSAAVGEAFAEVSRATGRVLAPVSAHRVDDAKIVCVAQGVAAAVAEVVADFLRRRERLKVGALSLCALRPFPAAAIAEHLRGKHDVIVVERAEGALAGDPPLAREVGATMRRAVENGRLGRRAHGNLGAWREKDAPILHAGIAGPGPRGVCSADLAAYCREVARGDGRSLVHLGVEFLPGQSPFPKRQALLDQLRRDHPGIGAFGLRAVERGDVRAEGSVTVDVAVEDLPAAARILRAMVGGQVRTSIEDGRARVSVGPGVRTPGCDAPVDVVVAPCHGVHRISDKLAHGAIAVLSCDEGDLPSISLDALRHRFVSVHRAPADWPDVRMGALVAALRTRIPGLEARRAIAEFERICAGDQKRVAAFQAALERTRAVDIDDDRCCPIPDRSARREPPRLLMPLSRPGSTHDSLPRFQDQVGVLQEAGQLDTITPDPYLAVGSVPPLSAAFAPPPRRRILPALDPAACTGCGVCWTACPDGAIAPVALTPRALVEAAIDRAKRVGANADGLRMLVGKLAARLRPAASAGDALRAAYAEVVAKSAPPEDRRAALDEAGAAAAAAVDGLPLAGDAAAVFGEDLLALVLDPDACKACGLCIEACPESAWSPADVTSDRITSERARWKVWEELPDTSGATIARVAGAAEPGLAAALSLSRHALLPMVAGDPAEPGSGPRLAARLLLGAVEAHGQPQVRARIEAVDALREELATKIRETLQSGLPATDLDALAEGLDALGHRDVALSDLAARVGDACEQGIVDGARLDRLVRTAKGLADLRFGLESGAQGLGRARYGLLIAPGPETAWATTFPWNPFAVPVAASGDPGGFAVGLAEGQIDGWLDEVRLARRARLELDRPAEAARVDSDLRALAWSDLASEERTGCPPLVLLGGAAALAGPSLDRTLGLLRDDLPVVVVALATDARPGDPELGLLALSCRDAFVAQTTVAHPDHLVAAVRSALVAGRPAFLHVLAPSPAAGGFSAAGTLERAMQRVRTRAFPLFVYDPTRDGVFGSRLDLAGNPAADAAEVDPRAATAWQTLRELAGVETPFVARVREEIEHEVANRHGAEVAGLRADAEGRRTAARAAVEQELAVRLRDKLTALAVRGMSR